MIMNFIMLSLGVALALSVIIWCSSAGYRRRIEEPKYRFLELTREDSNQSGGVARPPLHRGQHTSVQENSRERL